MNIHKGIWKGKNGLTKQIYHVAAGNLEDTPAQYESYDRESSYMKSSAKNSSITSVLVTMTSNQFRIGSFVNTNHDFTLYGLSYVI